MICDKFFGGDLKEKSLAAVASMAISEVGLSEFQKYIRELFLPFETGRFPSVNPLNSDGVPLPLQIWIISSKRLMRKFRTRYKS